MDSDDMSNKKSLNKTRVHFSRLAYVKPKYKKETFNKIEIAVLCVLVCSTMWGIITVVIASNVQNEYYNLGYQEGYVDSQLNNIQELKDAWQENVGIDYFNLNKQYEISCNSITYRRLPWTAKIT